MTLATYTRDMLRALEGARISKSLVEASTISQLPRAFAATGDGPDAGLTTIGRAVVLTGLPLTNAIERLLQLLDGFTISDIHDPILIPLYVS